MSPDHPDADDIPSGFEPVERGGPYFMMMGPTYLRMDGEEAILGLRVAHKHANMQGNAHGGMLATLADGALNMNLMRARGDRGKLVTVNLATEFLGPARMGDWLEARVEVRKSGRTLCFATCTLQVGPRAVLQANAIFAVIES
jgi:uncharacterized protein (TIGR00369 family)